MAIATPLSTKGRFIVDANGNRVRLAGVNWYGASEDLGVPAGLDRVHRNDLAQLIAAQGFNSVRFPFSVWMIEQTAKVPAQYLDANQDLVGKNPLGVYDACVNALTEQGLIVIPNCHMLDPGWCCGNDDGNGLWFNDRYPPARFENAWNTIASRYKSNPLVAAMDIKNEPRSAKVGGQVLTPKWGSAKAGQIDIAPMYQDVGNKILQINPHPLIICEGVSYACDLSDAGNHPIRLSVPNKVVYSMHDYSWSSHDGENQSSYNDHMHKKGGYLLTSNTAPVWVGEFGHVAGTATPQTTGWWTFVMAWLKDQDLDWCWWALNPTHGQSTVPGPGGPKPRASQGDGEPFGLLTTDWTDMGFPAVMGMLKAIMPPSQGPGIAATPHHA